MEIASPRKTPAETAPLLTSPQPVTGARRYGAIKPPALHITIPPPLLPRLPPPTDEGEFVVDLYGSGGGGRRVSVATPYTDECTCDYISPRTVCCDYCLQNDLYHHPPPPLAASRETPNNTPGRARRRWTESTENEGLLAVLEFLIDLQMQLLAVLVPGLLIFVLLVVVMERDA